MFGGQAGEYQGTIRTAWESLVLVAYGVHPQLVLDHADLNTTQRYLNVTAEELRANDAREAVEPADCAEIARPDANAISDSLIRSPEGVAI